MRKEDKALIIERLGEQLKEYAHFYLVDVTGLNAEATSNLRRKCFAEGIKMVVVKNTLLEKTFDKADVDFSPLVPVLKGTTAVMFCNTANVPAKLIKEAGKATGIPALKAAYAEEGFYVGANQLDAAQSRARTKLSPKWYLSSKALPRMLSLHSPARVQLFTVCLKLSARRTLNACA